MMRKLFTIGLALVLTVSLHAESFDTSILNLKENIEFTNGKNVGSRSWVQASPLPGSHTAGRYGHAQDPGNPDSFYIISGVGHRDLKQDVFRYDSGTDTWHTLQPIPIGNEGPGAAFYNGQIYVAGGGASTAFQIYNISTDNWSAGTDVPRPSWGTAMGAWNGKVFVIGGDPDFVINDTSDSVDIYNISSMTWSNGTAMPFPALAAGYAQSGRYLYIVGGFCDESPANNVTATQRYDMATDTWSIGPAFTSGRSDFALTIAGDFMYAIGGDANGGGLFDASDTVECLDLSFWPGGSWTDTGDSIPIALTGMRCGATTAAVTGQEIWLVGGLDAGFSFVGTTQYKEVPRTDWIQVTPMLAGSGVVRYAHAQDATDPDRFYIISGVNESASTTSNVWRYDSGSDIWSLLASVPVASEGAAAAYYSARIYVSGGSGSANFQIYDISENSWSAGPDVPRGFWGAATGAWDGHVFVIGGDADFIIDNVSDSVDIYNISSMTWSKGTDMPFPALSAGYVQSGKYLYIVGGWCDASPANNVTATQRYDMDEDTWSLGPVFASGRSDFSLTIAGDVLYAIGGDTSGGGVFDGTGQVEYLDLSEWPGGMWTDMEQPLPRGYSAVHCGAFTTGVTGAEIWLVGGFTTGGIVGTTQYLDIPVPPTPTPDCTVLGCEVFMPSGIFTAGDTCYCDVYICNPGTETYGGTPVFVILDVYGMYFFAPSFESFDCYTRDIIPGRMTINVLPSFPWPDNAGSASNIIWYAGMTDQSMTTLLGEVGMFTFGWEM